MGATQNVPQSIWIQRFLSDPIFCKFINRPVAVTANDMRDIVDGNIWKEFKKKNHCLVIKALTTLALY